MSDLSPEVAAALLMLAAVSVGFLIGWCFQPDNRDESESMLRRADKQAVHAYDWGDGRGAIFGEADMSEEKKEISAEIYCMAMRMTDAEAPPALVNQITRVACLIAGVPYPPERGE